MGLLCARQALYLGATLLTQITYIYLGVGRVFCSPGGLWPIAENDLELLSLLPPPSWCWGDSPWFLCLLNGKTSQSGVFSAAYCTLQCHEGSRCFPLWIENQPSFLGCGWDIGTSRQGLCQPNFCTRSGPTIQGGGCWTEACDWPSRATPSEVGLNITPQIQGVGLRAWPEARGLLGRSRDVFRSLGESREHHTLVPDGVPED